MLTQASRICWANPLRLACIRGDLAAARKALPTCPINDQDDYGGTALIWSLVKGFTDVAEWLVEQGAEISLPDGGGYTALSHAAEKGQAAALIILLRALRQAQRPGLNVPDEQKRRTPLVLAILGGHEAVALQLLTEDGVDLSTRDKEGCTALLYAASLGHTKVVQALVTASKRVPAPLNDLSAVDTQGHSALVLAILANHVDLAVWLVLSGAVDVSTVDSAGRTALHHAADRGQACVVRALVRAPNLQRGAFDNEGKTAYMLAADGGFRDVMAILVRARLWSWPAHDSLRTLLMLMHSL